MQSVIMSVRSTPRMSTRSTYKEQAREILRIIHTRDLHSMCLQIIATGIVERDLFKIIYKFEGGTMYITKDSRKPGPKYHMDLILWDENEYIELFNDSFVALFRDNRMLLSEVCNLEIS